MISINKDTSTMRIGAGLARSQYSINQATERLSSGLRINRATDDISRLSMASKMNAKLKSLGQVSQNLNAGTTFLQIADGGLHQIAELLSRCQTLAVQAATETNGPQQRALLDQEFQGTLETITQIAQTTRTPGGKLPLAGGIPGIPTIEDLFGPGGGSLGWVPSGLIAFGFIPGNTELVNFDINSGNVDDDIQIFTRNGVHVAGTNLTDGVWTSNGIFNGADAETLLFTAANGFHPDASYNSSSLVESGTGTVGQTSVTYSGEQQPGSNIETLQLSNITEPLLIFAVGNGQFQPTASWEGLGTESVEIAMNETGASGDPLGTFKIDPAPSDSGALGLYERDLLTKDSALEALDALKAAQETVTTYKADYGNSMKAIEVQRRRNSANEAALSQSVAALQDADFAEETAQLARAGISNELSTSLSAQTKRIHETALNLIRNTSR